MIFFGRKANILKFFFFFQKYYNINSKFSPPTVKDVG